MTAMLWQTTPVEVQALRWDGSPDGAAELVAWIGSKGGTAVYQEAVAPRMHSEHCMCDGRGIVPKTVGYSSDGVIPCPATETRDPGSPAKVCVASRGAKCFAESGEWVVLSGGRFSVWSDYAFTEGHDRPGSANDRYDEVLAVVRQGCCDDRRKPCERHDAYADGLEQGLALVVRSRPERSIERLFCQALTGEDPVVIQRVLAAYNGMRDGTIPEPFPEASS